MNDLLLRAWNLLTVAERPEGMVRNGELWHDHLAVAGGIVPVSLTDHAAYDRLTLALERKLLRAGLYLQGDNDYTWFYGEEMTPIAHHTDQLTAACLAAESMGGGG